MSTDGNDLHVDESINIDFSKAIFSASRLFANNISSHDPVLECAGHPGAGAWAFLLLFCYFGL
jgi:hypothetical protein